MTLEALELRLLGPVGAHRGEEAVPLGAPRQRLVLAVLAVNAGRLVPAERLINQIWGERVPGSGTGPLRTYVSQLRHALTPPDAPDDSPIVRRPPGYVLDIAPHQVDAHRFEAHVAEARAAASLHDWGRGLARLEEALALWRGPAFADLALEPAVSAEASRLDRLHADAMSLHVDALLAQGRSDEAIDRSRVLLEHDPLNEHLWAQLMLALYRAGRQSEALRCYAHARSALIEQLGVEPGPELRAREEAILRHEPGLAWRPAPPADDLVIRTSGAHGEVPGNLPHASTSFVGRVSEQRAVTDALRTSRLVALVGTGGAGKTRLALAVAGALESRYDGGAWFADLLPVTEPAGVARALAVPLGVDTDAGDQLEHLRRRIGGRRMLVVLDNCEHHLEPVAALVEDLLRSCSDLHILATSREQLRVPGERVLNVPPLTLPPPLLGAGVDREAITSSDAVELFLVRARAVVDDFEPVGHALDHVVAICRRLDGLPLAIELAAGLVGSLPVSAIADRLDDRFALLSEGRRTTVPRQRTLQAALDDSVDLLDEGARRVFERLGVFVGDFTLSAAEAVVADAVPPGQVARDLARLVAASMVQAVQGPAGTTSYRMLDTVRHHACARLDAAGGAHEVRRAHAEHYVRFAEEADRNVHGPHTSVWLDRIERERPNLRTALGWLFANDLDLALTMAGSLQWFFGRLGALEEGAQWLSAGLARGRVALPVRAKVLSALCAIRWLQGEFVETRELGEQAVALARAVDDLPSLKTALIARGHAAVYEADYGRAEECFSEGEDLCERTGDRWRLGWLLSGRAIAARRQGRLEDSRDAIDRALAIFGDLDDDYGRILLFLNLALISQQEGRLVEADTYGAQALHLAVQVGDRHCEHAATCVLGVTALGRGDRGLARAYFVRALTAYPGAEHRLMKVMALEGLATLAAGSGAHREAAITLGKAASMRSAWHLPLTNERRRERRQVLGSVEPDLGTEALEELLARGAVLDLQVVIDLAIGATGPLADQILDLREPTAAPSPAGTT